ncbi:MAG: hypothetical protein ACREJK_09945, partial [Candidatus Methylomirabilales bacterium]
TGSTQVPQGRGIWAVGNDRVDASRQLWSPNEARTVALGSGRRCRSRSSARIRLELDAPAGTTVKDQAEPVSRFSRNSVNDQVTPFVQHRPEHDIR